MTSFSFVMILCIMTYVGGWGRGTLCKCKKVTYICNVGQAVEAVDAVDAVDFSAKRSNPHSGHSKYW